MNAFSIIYILLLGLVWVLAIPFLLYFTCKKKYTFSIPARFFLKNNPPFEKDNIWFHGCSLGEIKSFKPLIEQLGLNVDLTTTTQTGFDEAKKLSKNVRFLPFEIFLPFWIKQPKILVVTEAELWYMLFFIAKKRGSHNILINARISDKSYKSYKRFSWFYKKIFALVDTVYAQSEIDTNRLKEFGAKNVHVNGNIKSASIPKLTCKYIKPNKRVITLASTHEGEEEAILDSLKIEKDDMLIIAPRHPERFKSVQKICEKYAKNMNFKKFSKDGFCECDVLLCDTLGELINIYAITDITILGGSFLEKLGGHNPLECAYFNNIIISGHNIHNQKTLYPLVENIYMCEASEINELLKQNLKQTYMKNKNPLKPIIQEIKRENEARKSV